MQQLSAQSQANQLQQQAIIQQIQQSLRASSPTVPGTATGHHFMGPRQMPKIPTSIRTNPLDRLTNTEDIISEGQVDMLDVPGKGRCYVYIARFSYEPFQHSPNANPEAELPVQGGDYLLVWGQPDEDGFLDAETLDGRRGLVPANFVQKLVGDDLLEFHQAVLGLRDVDDSVSTNIPQVSNDMRANEVLNDATCFCVLFLLLRRDRLLCDSSICKDNENIVGVLLREY